MLTACIISDFVVVYLLHTQPGSQWASQSARKPTSSPTSRSYELVHMWVQVAGIWWRCGTSSLLVLSMAIVWKCCEFIVEYLFSYSIESVCALKSGVASIYECWRLCDMAGKVCATVLKRKDNFYCILAKFCAPEDDRAIYDFIEFNRIQATSWNEDPGAYWLKNVKLWPSLGLFFN